jgi:alkanesulfonate monooxygenase SsuD/methylene tetrahydromethanopterin reductase-like flavin-dependent oxidoreductase (luciferase family)
MRNAFAHAGRSGRRVVSAFIGTAFAQDDAEAARLQWRRVADQLRPKLPKLAAFLDEAETDVSPNFGPAGLGGWIARVGRRLLGSHELQKKISCPPIVRCRV